MLSFLSTAICGDLEEDIGDAKPNQETRLREGFVPNPKARLFDQIREVMRFHHYSYRTEKSYSHWVRRFLDFHRRSDRTGPDKGWRHPHSLGAAEVASFLSHLANAGNVSASTQNQALNALVFLYEQVLQVELGTIGEFARVTRPARLPEVLTQEQTRRVLAALKPGTASLIIRLLYGTGMRVMEGLRLRVKDLAEGFGRGGLTQALNGI